MFSFSDQRQHASELLKVRSLSCPELILLKEWNDLVSQIRNRSHTEAIKMLLVIVSAAINEDPSTFKELFEIMQCRQTFLSLSYDELRKYLPARKPLSPSEWLLRSNLSPSTKPTIHPTVLSLSC